MCKNALKELFGSSSIPPFLKKETRREGSKLHVTAKFVGLVSRPALSVACASMCPNPYNTSSSQTMRLAKPIGIFFLSEVNMYVLDSMSS